jgi:Poly-gamma-glutamate hydrolase
MADKYATFSELAQRERARVGTFECTCGPAAVPPRLSPPTEAESSLGHQKSPKQSPAMTFLSTHSKGSNRARMASCTSPVPGSTNRVALPSWGRHHGLSASTGKNANARLSFLEADGAMLGRLRNSLSARGFTCETHESSRVQGLNPANICNRTASGAGVQLELSRGLRRSFFESLSQSGRRSTTQQFHQFVAAVREAVGEGTTRAAARRRLAGNGAPPE